MSERWPWFRYYSETADDRKFLKIARDTGMSRLEVIGAWSLIMCIASESPRRGFLLATIKERFTDEDLSDQLGLPPERVKQLIAGFILLEMIDLIDGIYHLKNWEKRQPASDNSAERVRKHREGNKDETLQGRYSNVTVAEESRFPSSSSSLNLNSLSTLNVENPEGKPNVFAVYESEIGALTPTISDELAAAADDHPEGWVEDALRESSRVNKRSWKYAQAILKRWKAEGRTDKPHPGGNGNGKIKLVRNADGNLIEVPA